MDTVELLLNLAVEHKSRGRLREAIDAYSEAFDYLLMEARSFAKNTIGYDDTGETRAISPEYFNAVRNYLRRDENAARISNNGGVLFAQLGDYETAKIWFEQAIDLHPKGEYEEAAMNLKGINA